MEFTYPGPYKELIQAGAMDEGRSLAELTNTKDQIDLVAQEVNI